MSTVDKKEVEKFSRLAKDWWNPNGKFKPLHVFNPTRVEFIKEKLISYFNLDLRSNEPLKNFAIATADRSEPPLPKVVTLSSSVMP